MAKIAQENTLQKILASINNPARCSDFYLEVAKGNVPKHLDYSALGINSDIDTATTPEDILVDGGIFVPPTTYRIHNVVSTSANDTSAGTGARVVTVYGVVSTGLAEEAVTMNGTTPVATVNAYSDIYILDKMTPGSGGTNEGVITATAQVDGTVTATIEVGAFNTSKKAIRLIPPNHTGYLHDWYASMENNVASTNARCNLLIKPSGGAWTTQAIHSLSNTGNNHEKDDFKVPIKLEAGTWVKIQCNSVSNNNTLIQASFNLTLVQA